MNPKGPAEYCAPIIIFWYNHYSSLVLWIIEFYKRLFSNTDYKYNRVGQLLNTNENLGHGEDRSKYFKCRSCGKEFDSFGDMQKHIMTEHMQKGDIP